MVIKIIKHSRHRYSGTVGDYWLDKKGIHQVRVSEMSDWRFTALIIIHELVEYFGCLQRGIKEADVTSFDVLYECERKMGLHKPEDEPGHDKRAPYHECHVFAEKIEILVANFLKVNWNKYSKEVEGK